MIHNDAYKYIYIYRYLHTYNLCVNIYIYIILYCIYDVYIYIYIRYTQIYIYIQYIYLEIEIVVYIVLNIQIMGQSPTLITCYDLLLYLNQPPMGEAATIGIQLHSARLQDVLFATFILIWCISYIQWKWYIEYTCTWLYMKINMYSRHGSHLGLNQYGRLQDLFLQHPWCDLHVASAHTSAVPVNRELRTMIWDFNSMEATG